MNISELVTSIEVELEVAQKRAQKSKAEIQMILDSASQEGRSSLSETEEERINELFSSIDNAKAQEQGIRSKLENARRVQAEDAELDKRASEVIKTNAPTAATREQRVHVTREERTYNRSNDPTGQLFLRDVVAQFVSRDVTASTRLARHMQEERVESATQLRAAGDVTTATGSGSGLVIPQYLIDLTAPAVTNMRPFADVANGHLLPAAGMALDIPRVTTSTSAAVQSTELGAVSAQSAVIDTLSVPVHTAAGQQNVSRQAIDRGTGMEDVLMQDLFAQYATNLDSEMLNEATHGLTAISNGGAGSVSYGDSAPTGAALYPYIQAAAAQVETALLGRGQATHVIMTSKRWFWLLAQMTNEWPLIAQPGLPDARVAGSNAGDGYAAPVRGRLPNGLYAVVDNNVTQTDDGTGKGTGGNNDVIFVVPRMECHLWEESAQPRYIRAEQPNAPELGVLLVVYGYFAFTFERYADAMGEISGTGLSGPAF